MFAILAQASVSCVFRPQMSSTLENEFRLMDEGCELRGLRHAAATWSRNVPQAALCCPANICKPHGHGPFVWLLALHCADRSRSDVRLRFIGPSARKSGPDACVYMWC